MWQEGHVGMYRRYWPAYIPLVPLESQRSVALALQSLVPSHLLGWWYIFLERGYVPRGARRHQRNMGVVLGDVGAIREIIISLTVSVLQQSDWHTQC